MWASPSIIPINISLISLGNSIAVLSDKDKQVNPFVERAYAVGKTNNTQLYINNILEDKSIYELLNS